MPDLTIKPVGAAGNKLILQDQAGGAVLTTADSGATIANATLTTPTVANMSNFTFPAGHVRYLTSSAEFSYSNITADQDILGSDLSTGTITAGSKILLKFNGSCGCNSTAGYAQLHWYGKSASTGTATDSGLTATSISTNQACQELGYQRSGTTANFSPWIVVQTLNGATSATYNMRFDVSSGSRGYWIYDCHMSLWEVF